MIRCSPFLPMATLLVLVGWSCRSTAEEVHVHYDVLVTSSTFAGPRLVIGGYNHADSSLIIPAGEMRVFGGNAVGSDPGAAYQSDSEPGFEAATQPALDGNGLSAYQSLSGSTSLTFSFLPISIGATTRNLLFWDGIGGSPSFAPVSDDMVLSLDRYGAGSWTRSISGSSATTVPGAEIAKTSATGDLHKHLFVSLTDSGTAPPQGFFLFSLTMQMAGYTDSEPLYFVFGAYDPLVVTGSALTAFEAAHESAMTWVENNVVAVPEPSGLVLAGLGALGAFRAVVRRRRSDRQRSSQTA